MVMAGYPHLAVILAILATILLTFKAELHGIALNLERRDLISILQFAVVAFVVLPLLPDRAFGPYAALNPRDLWLIVVLISGMSLAGYVALRFVGPDHGPLLLGVFDGLVSSTATTLAYSRYARTVNEFVGVFMTVIITANLVLLVRLAVLGAILAPAILVMLAPVLAIAFVAGGMVYALGRRHDAGQGKLTTVPPIGNPAELRTALGLAVLYAVVLLLAAWLTEFAGSKGMYAIAVVSGLTDVDAITLSSLRLYGVGTLSAAQVTTAIVLAVSANALFKLAIVRFVGGDALFRRCVPAMTAIAAGAGLGTALFT